MSSPFFDYNILLSALEFLYVALNDIIQSSHFKVVVERNSHVETCVCRLPKAKTACKMIESASDHDSAILFAQGG
jgi:hypothetical protein